MLSGCIVIAVPENLKAKILNEGYVCSSRRSVPAARSVDAAIKAYRRCHKQRPVALILVTTLPESVLQIERKGGLTLATPQLLPHWLRDGEARLPWPLVCWRGGLVEWGRPRRDVGRAACVAGGQERVAEVAFVLDGQLSYKHTFLHYEAPKCMATEGGEMHLDGSVRRCHSWPPAPGRGDGPASIREEISPQTVPAASATAAAAAAAAAAEEASAGAHAAPSASGVAPSLGSLLHPAACRRCRHWAANPAKDRCRLGVLCSFCHVKHANPCGGKAQRDRRRREVHDVLLMP